MRSARMPTPESPHALRPISAGSPAATASQTVRMRWRPGVTATPVGVLRDVGKPIQVALALVRFGADFLDEQCFCVAIDGHDEALVGMIYIVELAVRLNGIPLLAGQSGK